MSVIDRIVERALELRRLYAEYSDRPLLGLLRKSFTFGFVVICLWFIWDQFSSDYAVLLEAELEFRPVFLLLAGLSLSSATALGAWEWAMLVKALDVRFDIWQGMRVGLLSNLAKYVPGFVWSYMGKVYGATTLGVPKSTAGLSLFLEFFIVFSGGIMLIVISAPFSGLLSLSESQQWVLQLIAGSTVALFFLLFPRFGRMSARYLRQEYPRLFHSRDFDWGRITLVSVAVLLTWCLLGLGFAFLVSSLSHFDWSLVPRLVIAIAIALLLGQIAFVVPMGIGVREMVLVSMLRPLAEPSMILFIALAFRVVSLFGEVLTSAIGHITVQFMSSGRNNTNG